MILGLESFTDSTLVYRRLFQLEGLEKPVIVALYENMQLTMTEADRIKPSFVEIGVSLL